MPVPHFSNPGLSGLDELTSAEEAIVASIASLGAATNVLAVNGAGDGVEWVAAGGFNLTVQEVDASPSVSAVDTIVFPNGTVTDDGGGQVTITISGTGDVTAASNFGTDNVLIRSDGTGKGVQATGISIADTTDAMSGMASITIDASGSLLFGAVTILSDSSGTTTLSNIDSIDTTTEATIEAALDTLSNLTTVDITGDLDVDNININGNTISATNVNGGVTVTPNGTGNVTLGTMVFDSDQTIGAGQDNFVLTYDNAAGTISLEAAAGGGGANTLDQAYDEGGAGAGRTITADTGAVTITVPAAANNVGLVINQDDTTNNGAGLHIIANTNGTTQPVAIFETETVGGEAVIDIVSDTGTGAMGRFQMLGENSVGTDVAYGKFRTFVQDNTDASEDSYLIFSGMKAGAEFTPLRVGLDGLAGISVGTSSETAIIESHGDQDLEIRTGNATTGSITITDGANGNINLAPNGTGEAQVSGQKIIDETDTASTTAAGIVEHATTAEVDTGTDTGRTVTPDTLAGSYAGKKSVGVMLVAPGTDAATGTSLAFFTIPEDVAGMNLVSVHAEVTTAGTTGVSTWDINKNGTSMLSTKLTIDSAETGSDTAATAAVIDGAQDNVSENDVITIDCDGVSTTAPQGTFIRLTFQLP